MPWRFAKALLHAAGIEVFETGLRRWCVRRRDWIAFLPQLRQAGDTMPQTPAKAQKRKAVAS